MLTRKAKSDRTAKSDQQTENSMIRCSDAQERDRRHDVILWLLSSSVLSLTDSKAVLICEPSSRHASDKFLSFLHTQY